MITCSYGTESKDESKIIDMNIQGTDTQVIYVTGRPLKESPVYKDD